MSERRGSQWRGRGVAVAAAALALFLSSCASTASAGAAATVGDLEISNDTLTSQVNAVQQAKLGSSGMPDAALVNDVLQRLVITDLVTVAAERNGVSATQGQVDQARAGAEAQLGGPGSLIKAFLDSNVPESAIDDQLRISVLVQGLGGALAPQADAQGQQQAVFEYVVALSNELGTQVSPRYGTWDAQQLQIGPVPSDLSAPQATEDPLASLVPAG